jgi:hypothetical protein
LDLKGEMIMDKVDFSWQKTAVMMGVLLLGQAGASALIEYLEQRKADKKKENK